MSFMLQYHRRMSLTCCILACVLLQLFLLNKLYSSRTLEYLKIFYCILYIVLYCNIVQYYIVEKYLIFVICLSSYLSIYLSNITMKSNLCKITIILSNTIPSGNSVLFHARPSTNGVQYRI